MRIITLARRSILMVGAWDSAIVSLSGFLTNVLAGRFLVPVEYGLFITAFIVANMAMLIQSSFISSPYAILAPRMEAAQRREYLAGSTWITCGSTIPVAIILSTGMYFYFRKTLAGMGLATALAIFAFYVATVMLQDFVRRACFTHRREPAALLLDIISAGGQVLFLVALRSRMTLDMALMIVSGTTALGIGAVYLVPLRNKSLPIRLQPMRQAARENVVLGKWLFVTAGVSWIANQIYILAVATFQTPIVVAQLGAARTIAAVSNPAIMTVENMGTPRASRLVHESGDAALRRFIGKITLVGCLPFLALGALCFAYPDTFIRILFHRSFGEISTLVRIFSLMPFMWFATRSIAVGINALKKPRALLPVYAIIACTTLTIGVYLAKRYGALGAAYGLLFNSILMVTGFLIQFLRLTRRGSSGVQAS
jgi:O-antigen/teichoic acid export membrane protein